VGFSPEQLEVECRWIDEHVGDKPYGVDLVIPQKYEGMGEIDPAKLEEHLREMIPLRHREFAAKLLADHGVPELPPENRARELLGWTAATAAPQVEVALKHPKVRLIANALGTPPQDVIDQVHKSGRLVAALCGRVHQAVRHAKSGIDIIIAQGTEGGGHTGEIGSLVLWPQVIDAVAPVPVLAAGGIGTGRQIAAGRSRSGRRGPARSGSRHEARPSPRSSTRTCARRRDGAPRSWTGALPHAEERLDRGVGATRLARAARHAPTRNGDDGRDRADQPLRRLGSGAAGRLQPRGADRGADEGDPLLPRGDLRPRRGLRRGDGAARRSRAPLNDYFFFSMSVAVIR
jgi:hypothetical protein